MSYQPMPFRSDVTSVLSLAQTVADDFSRAPRVFSAGEQAAIELISALRSYQQFHSARDSSSNNGPESQANFESSLAANLRPCRDALDTMLEIRQKYGRAGRDGKLGIADSVRWRLDETHFGQQVAALRQDTARLRELVQELQRSAVRSMSQQEPSRDRRGFGAPAVRTRTTVSIYPPQHTVTQGTPTASFSSSNPQNENQTPTKMCPNGSGCRTPRCHLNYLHPRAPSCANGKNCGVTSCDKWHPKSPLCPRGASCPMVGCDKAHPWPREPPVFPISYPPPDEGLFNSLSTSMTNLSSTMASQSPQPSERGSRDAPSRQTPWRETGTTRPATQPAGPIVVMEVQSTLAGGDGNPRSPNNNNIAGNQGWCRLRFQCPGGYNGVCPLRHPRRAACRALADHGRCPRGASCTYDHSTEAAAAASQDRAQGDGSGYAAELPAWR